MDEILLSSLVDRYLNNEMTDAEKNEFSRLRAQNQEVDQFVVEHIHFLTQFQKQHKRTELNNLLNQVHNNLLDSGSIEIKQSAAPKVIQLWHKYKRTIAVAATIAGITAFFTSGTVHMVSNKPTESYIQQLSRKVDQQTVKINEQNREIKKLSSSQNETADTTPALQQISSGTSFLIDGAGYLITNAHVLKGANTLVVVNKNKEYKAESVYIDPATDIAILQIKDKKWKSNTHLPYTIRKNNPDLGEEIFTMGFPRNEIVYNKGYMSARSGYNDDTLSIQIAIGANPGNSGGPLFDKNGNIIGILSTRDKQANEVVFASKALNIIHAVEHLKKDSSNINIKLPNSNNLKGLDIVSQTKKIEDCVFMVKTY